MVRISLSWRKSRSRQQLFCTMTSRTSFVGVLLTFVAIVMMVENVECHQDIPNINNKRIWRGQTTTVPKISSSSKIITNVSNLKNMIGRLRGGGASPSSTPGIIARLAPPVISKKPSDSSSSFRIPGYQQNQQQYTDQQQQQMIDDRQESKEMMDSFLTRDSRNSFIGT